MGRGVAPLVTMAFSLKPQDQEQAAELIANFLLKRGFRERLVEVSKDTHSIYVYKYTLLLLYILYITCICIILGGVFLIYNMHVLYNRGVVPYM